MTLFGSRTQKPDIELLKRSKDTDGLIHALLYDDFETQMAAAEALGALGSGAMDQLLKKIRSRNRAVKISIIEALGVIRDPRAVDPLLEALGDKNAEVRWESAIALGEIGDDRAIPALIKALEDPDKYVRYGAAFALSKIGWKPADAREKALYFLGMQEWWVLKDMGKPAIEALSVSLKDTDSDIRLKAIELLGEMHDHNVAPALIQALADENSAVRWKAVVASTKAGVPLMYLPRGLSKRPRIRKNPKIAAFLNFTLPGVGYGYLGKWWGVIVFQFDVALTLWLLRFGKEELSTIILLPLYVIIAIHAAYIAIKMPDM
jgi:HEAT repeat protein